MKPGIRQSRRRTSRLRQSALEALEPRRLLTRLVGIDVSEHNGTINWTSVHASRQFAFIRATYGKESDDATFLNNVNASTGAIAKGMYAGFYHYAYYDIDSTHTATAEADNFFDLVKPYLNSGGKVMNPVLDVEEPLRSGWSAANLVQWVQDWGSRVKSRGQSELGLSLTPIIYMGASNSGNANYISSALSQTFPLWVAQWPGGTVDAQNGEPSGSGFWQDWQVWQYADNGTVSGISGAVDLDTMNGDTTTVQDYIIGSVGKWADGTWVQVNTASGLKAWDASTSNPNAPYNDTAVVVPNGTIGKILQGPVYGNGYMRWQIQYTNGVTGWSAEPFLSTPTPTVATNPNPANNANLAALPANFTWSATNAGQYKVYLDGTLKATLTSNAWAHPTIGNGTHNWRVDTINGPNTVTGTTWNFNYTNTTSIPSDPTPGIGEIVNTKPLTLDWADTPGADSYDIYFSSNTSPTGTVTTSQFGPITPADGNRLWRVVAKSGGTPIGTGPQWQYTMDTVPPTATYGRQSPSAVGAPSFDFTVTYADATTSPDASTFDANDITVTGPNSFVANAVVISAAGNVVTYRIAAPDGAWDGADNGAYTVSLNPNQVTDLAGNFAAAGSLGTFNVAMPTWAYMTGSTLDVQFDGTAVPIALAMSGSDVAATRDGVTLTFSGVTSIDALGSSGDDRLQINDALTPPLSFEDGGGNDLIEITSGTYTFNSDAGGANQNIGVLVAGGAFAVFNATQHLRSLSVDGVASVALGGGNVIVTRSLAITGKLNLRDNDMIIDYVAGNSPIGVWNGSAYTGVTGMLASGRGPDGDYTGDGIITDQSDAIAPASFTTLAVAEASDVFGLGGADTVLFDGQTVDASTVIVKYTYAGDANMDGMINGDDYFQIDSAFPQGLHGYFNGDFNFDGVINGDDYFLIDSNFPAQGPPI